MIRKSETVCVYFIGSILYNLIELLWRGYTHWSMGMAGGVCLTLLHLVNQRKKRAAWPVRCLIGCGLITAVEFTAGLIVNRLCGLDVWDYSDRRFNLLGQICPLYSAFWLLLTIPAYALSDRVRRFFDYLIRREGG